MVMVPAGVTYTATDEVSDVVRKIAENEKKNAAAAAKAVIDAEAKKTRARELATAALEAAGLKAEEHARVVQQTASEIIAAEQRQAREVERAAMEQAAAQAKAAQDAADAQKKAHQEAKKYQEEVERSAQESFLEMKAKFDFLVGSIKMVGGALLEFAQAAAAAEQVERRLTIIMGLHGETNQEVVDGLLHYNAAMQAKLGLDADHLTQLQGTLSLQGVANEDLQKATEYTIGLAQVTGSLDAAARLVSGAYQGNFESFRRYRLEIDNGTEAQEKFNELFQVAEKQTDLLATKMGVLSAQWGELLENIGKTKEVQAAANKTTKVATQVVNSLNARLEGGAGLFQAAAVGSALFADKLVELSPRLRIVSSALEILQRNDIVPSLEADAGALEKVAEGADAAKRAIEEMAKASVDLGHVEFSNLEGESIEGDPKRFKREQEEKVRAAWKAVDERLDAYGKEAEIQKEIEDEAIRREEKLKAFQAKATTEGLAFKLKLQQEARDRIRNNEQAGEAERTKIQEDAEKKRTDNARREQEKRLDAARRGNEQLTQLSIGASQAITQGIISTAASFAQASEIEREAYEQVHGVHQELTRDEQILADASKQAAEIREQAVKQLASTAITEIGKVVAALVTQTLASGAATAGQVAQDASLKVGWPGAMAVVPAVIGAITAIFAGLVTGFAQGGLVTGGTPGKDSVPAMLMPGERVLTVDQNLAFERAMSMPTHSGPFFAEGGVVGRNRPGQNITLVIQQMVPERDANFRRTVNKTVVPALSQATRDGAAIRDPRSFGP